MRINEKEDVVTDFKLSADVLEKAFEKAGENSGDYGWSYVPF